MCKQQRGGLASCKGGPRRDRIFFLLSALGLSWLGYAVDNTYFPDFDKGGCLAKSGAVVSVFGALAGGIAFWRFGSGEAGKIAVLEGSAILLVLWLRL